jgi:hypothetical protein
MSYDNNVACEILQTLLEHLDPSTQGRRTPIDWNYSTSKDDTLLLLLPPTARSTARSGNNNGTSSSRAPSARGARVRPVTAGR